ncbi:hypothetical protein ACJX0J_005673, partial [Zea mays]
MKHARNAGTSKKNKLVARNILGSLSHLAATRISVTEQLSCSLSLVHRLPSDVFNKTLRSCYITQQQKSGHKYITKANAITQQQKSVDIFFIYDHLEGHKYIFFFLIFLLWHYMMMLNDKLTFHEVFLDILIFFFIYDHLEGHKYILNFELVNTFELAIVCAYSSLINLLMDPSLVVWHYMMMLKDKLTFHEIELLELFVLNNQRYFNFQVTNSVCVHMFCLYDQFFLLLLVNDQCF